MKAVIYGAGNIGRGFIGQLLYQSGYELTFIDVIDAAVEAINKEGCYPVRIISEDNHQDIWINGIRAIHGAHTEEAAEAIASADIMATAVGVRALPFIAPVIAAGLQKRFIKNRQPLNIIICENLIDADTFLAKLIKEQLSAEELTFFNETVGLVEASIGRMIPLQTAEMKDNNPLRICVEEYGILPVDKAAFRGAIPSVTNMRPHDNFSFYIQRKLFIHNMGHGICAYLGLIHGDNFIYEAVRHEGIRLIAHNAMLESAAALAAKYRESAEELHDHINDLLRRFSNKALGDTCARVGSDTIRKLGNRDRFIGAIHLCSEEHINPAFIIAGASAALYCHLREQGIVQNEKSARKALVQVSELEECSIFVNKIITLYSILNNVQESKDFNEMIKSIITCTGKITEEQ